MSTVSATYKILECTDSESDVNQLTREVSYANDVEALKYKTSAGDFKYFYPNNIKEITASNYEVLKWSFFANALVGAGMIDDGLTVDIMRDLIVDGETDLEGSLKVVNNISAVDIKGSGDIFTEEWQSYTPTTLNGWKSGATSAFYYKQVGDLVFLKYDVSGLSTTASEVGFDLPVSAFSSSIVPKCGLSQENTEINDALLLINSNNTKYLYGNAAVGYENQTRTFCGQTWYKKA